MPKVSPKRRLPFHGDTAPRALTVIDAGELSTRLGAHVTLATETFQHTGSFKFRAAYNLVSMVPNHGIIVASSGNFGQAVAYAAQVFNKSCTVVMPTTSARVKVEAVRRCGGMVAWVDTANESREARVQHLARSNPEAYVAKGDDPLVIQGNQTIGDELNALNRKFDCIVAPVGGGSLIAGLSSAFARNGERTLILGAEPEIANDASRSLKAGYIVSNDDEPRTIADGAKVRSLFPGAWKLIQNRVADIVEVSEEAICEALRLMFSLAHLKAEPTAALSVGALLSEPTRFRKLSVCCIVTGANVDPALFSTLLSSPSTVRGCTFPIGVES